MRRFCHRSAQTYDVKMAINRDVAEIVDEIGRTDEISHNKSSKIISMVKTAVKTTETEF